MSGRRFLGMAAFAAWTCLFDPGGALAQTEDYADWMHFRAFDLKPGLNNPLTNFPLLVRLDASNAADIFTGAKSGGADLRFRRRASQNSETWTDHQLNYQIAYWDSAARKAEIWVLVDSLYPYDGDNQGPYPQALYLHWGKQDAPARSSAAKVFDTANGFVGVWHMGGSSPSAPRPNSVSGGNPAMPSGSSVGTGFPLNAGAIGLGDEVRGGTDGGANASDDHFNLGSFTADFSTGMTMSLWIKPAAPVTSAWNVFMALGNGAPGDNLTLGRIGGTNNLFGEVYDGVTGGGRTVADNVISYGEWQYVAFAVKDSAQTAYWFSGYSSSRTRTATATIPNVTRNMAYLGRSLWPDPNPAVSIDEARLSKVRRSLDWIRLEFNTQHPYPNFEPKPVQKVNNPPAPALSAPGVNATAMPAFVTLSWGNLSSNYKYRVQVSTDSLFTAPLVNTLVSGPSHAVGPLSGSTTYYWRVLTWDSHTGTGPWSATRKFTVAPQPTEVATPILALPAAFSTLTAPTNTFSWNHASGATSYHLQVGSVPDFSALVRNDSGITALSRMFSLTNGNREYYWRVRGKNANGVGPWSEIRAFIAAFSSPSVPDLLTPENFATDVPAGSPTLSWSPASGAVSYRVQVSLAPDFTAFVSNDTTTATSRVLGNLSGLTHYYWRVNAKNSRGTSAYSSIRRFTTGEPVALAPHPSGPFSVSALRVGEETVVRLTLPRAERVTVRRRDLQGRLSAPVRDETLPAGSYSLRLSGMPAGVGILDLKVGAYTRTLLVGL